MSIVMASHGYYCCVEGCNVHIIRDNVSFFRCPKDPERYGQWKKVLNFVGDHKYANLTTEEAHSRIRICRRHFDDQSFGSSGKRLLHTAVPSKLLPTLNGQINLKSEASTQTDVTQGVVEVSTTAVQTSDEEVDVLPLLSDVSIQSGFQQEFILEPATLVTPTSSNDVNPSPPLSRGKAKLKADLKFKCGACGNVGHIRTNKACPIYQNSGGTNNDPVNDATTKEPEEIELEIQLNTVDEDLVNVDDTKVNLSGGLLKPEEDIKRTSPMLEVPKDASANKKRQAGVLRDYLKKHFSPANRRRTNPIVVLSTILENILNEIRDMPDVQPFLFPVNPKLVMGYHTIIQRPMDLQTICEKLRQRMYQSRQEFLADVNQIVENCNLSNGPTSSLTIAAQRMLAKCVERLGEKEERLLRLEKAINPLLDNDDQVTLTFILDNIVNTKLKTMPESLPFLNPVNKHLVKEYYNIVKKPIDLESISNRVAAHKYHSRHEFLVDIEQILHNCILCNGKESSITEKAEQLVKACKAILEEHDEQLKELEKKLLLAQERAKQDDDQAWMDGDDANHTVAEPDQNSQIGSPNHPSIKSEVLNYEQVDIKCEINQDLDENLLTGSPKMKKIKKEEWDEVVPSNEFKREQEGILISAELPMDGEKYHDSQQAAEAMVRLGAIGHHQENNGKEAKAVVFKEEIMDADPNTGPSDFLMTELPVRIKIKDPLAI